MSYIGSNKKVNNLFNAVSLLPFPVHMSVVPHPSYVRPRTPTFIRQAVSIINKINNN